MPLTHHPLVKELPEFKDKIHEMKMNDHHFQRLMEQYEEVDKHIFRIESDEEPTGDAYVTDLRKERLKLKDELYNMLQA
jgi:hypothetical protein